MSLGAELGPRKDLRTPEWTLQYYDRGEGNALMLLHGADFLSVFDKRQLKAMAMLFLDLHRYGYVVGWIFGLFHFHFGVLVFRSGFLPRILGVTHQRMHGVVVATPCAPVLRGALVAEPVHLAPEHQCGARAREQG